MPFGIDDALIAGAIALSAAGGVASSAISAGAANGGNYYTPEMQQQLNLANQTNQYMFNSALARQQFNYNKWFTEHGHQSEVADLKAAGLNPILSANNGAYSQTGLGSVGMANTDLSSFNSAEVQKQQLKLSMANTISDTMMKASQSAKTIEEAKTQSFQRSNLQADTALKNSQELLNGINYLKGQKEYQYIDAEKKAQISNLEANTKSTIAHILIDRLNANANITSAGALSRNASINEKAFNIDKDVAKRYKEFGERHPIARNIDETLSRYLGGFSGSVSGSFSKKFK